MKHLRTTILLFLLATASQAAKPKHFEGVSKHTRSPDFMIQFTTWMGAILKPVEAR